MRRLTARALLLALPLGLAACGGAGDGDSGGGGNDGGSGGSVVSPQPKAVTGSFFLGSLDRPAAGFEVWVVDQTTRSYMRLTLDDAGAFSHPVSSFVEGHTYSLHLVRDFQLIGDIDLSSAVAGTQAAFVYQGGYGFDVGQVVLPLTSHGTVDTSGASPSGQVGGGFSLDRTLDAGLRAWADPDDVTGFGIGSELVVVDASTLLFGVYRRPSYPAATARALSEGSRLLVKLAADPAKVTRAFAVDGGAWLAAARLADGDDAARATAARWIETDYELAAVDGGYRASVLTGGPPAAGTILVVKTQPPEGAQSAVPKILPRVLTLPPRVLAVNAAGGAPATVDYASATAENGLSKPFCQTGDVRLTLAPPEDETGAAVAGGVLDEITVSLDYYGIAGGRTVALAVKDAVFPAPYDAESATWSPATATLTVPLDAASAAAATQSVTIPQAVLIDAIGEAGVFRIRARVRYRSTTEATESAVAFWLDKDC